MQKLYTYTNGLPDRGFIVCDKCQKQIEIEKSWLDCGVSPTEWGKFYEGRLQKDICKSCLNITEGEKK